MAVCIRVFFFLLIAAVGFSCSSSGAGFGQIIKSAPAGNGLTVKLLSADGVIRDGKNQLTLIFENEQGVSVDVGAASLNFNMPAMGTMPEMNDPAVLTTTRRPGVYSAAVKLQMAGEWIGQIAYEGRAGKGKIVMPVTAQ